MLFSIYFTYLCHNFIHIVLNFYIYRIIITARFTKKQSTQCSVSLKNVQTRFSAIQNRIPRQFPLVFKIKTPPFIAKAISSPQKALALRERWLIVAHNFCCIKLKIRTEVSLDPPVTNKRGGEGEAWRVRCTQVLPRWECTRNRLIESDEVRTTRWLLTFSLKERNIADLFSISPPSLHRSIWKKLSVMQFSAGSPRYLRRIVRENEFAEDNPIRRYSPV